MTWPGGQTAWPPQPIPTTVREVVRNLIVQGVPEVNGRVYQAELAPANPQTPFIIMRMGNDTAISDWGSYATPLYVWPFIGEGDSDVSYTLLDLLGSKIVQAVLQGQAGIMVDEAAALGVPVVPQPGQLAGRWLVSYAGVGVQDTRDEVYQALTRPVYFNIGRISWRPEVDHQVLRALRAWTLTALPLAQVDAVTFAPTAQAPAVYWRFATLPVVDEDITFDWHMMQCQVQGHVLAPNPSDRILACAQLAATMADTYKGRTLVDPTTGYQVTVHMQRADASIDPMAIGQLTVVARYIQVDDDGSGYPPGTLPVDPNLVNVAHVWLNGRPLWANYDGPPAARPVFAGHV